ncbi:MAG: prolyl oligopeptidase family serine peptidase, partial [Desulfuromonadales bacterium]|nr:prolyl oligopeptidase family serine peptidase [Desulfuromonadales bacterium]
MLDLARSTKLKDAQIVVPESDAVITGFEATRDGVYVVRIAGGLDTLSYIPVRGGKPQAMVLPVKGVVSDVRISADGTTFSFSMSGPVVNTRYFDVSGRTVRALGLQADSYPNARAFEVVSEQALSADKTEVPMTILRRRGASLAGQTPTLIFAYGAYGDPMRPGYLSPIFPWLEEGGVFAVCHARGGGEKGRSWHEAGKGRNKPNGHADLIACAEHLIERRYTKAGRITVFGFSMAGVLIGPAVLKRPDLFKVGALSVAFLNPT